MKKWMAIPLVFALAAAGLAMGVVLFLFDPSTHAFYPQCALHQTTGLLCPGCGTLRALHQLTHGNFAAAWGFNPFVLLLMPVGLWLVIRESARLFFGKQWPGLVTNPIFGWTLLAVMLVFGVLRNIPLHQ